MKNKKKKSSLSRRKFVQLSGLSAIGLASVGVKAAESCFLTPAQGEGPFYPNVDKEWDLTANSTRQMPKGELIYLTGQLKDQNCNLVQDALVEIWQADDSGRYNHVNDPRNDKPIDKHFNYWGRCYTDEEGRFVFKSVIPGAYPASGTWWRPPHIHVKVHKRGYLELTSQLYFKGNSLNKDDLILKNLNQSEQDSVIVDYKATNDSIKYKNELILPEQNAGVGQIDLSVQNLLI